MTDDYKGLKIEQFTVGMLEVNCYIVYDLETMQGIIVDPGDEGPQIMHHVEDLGLKISMIVLTHGHGDHIGAIEYLHRHLSLKVAIGKEDAEMLTSASLNLSDALGMPMALPPADILLSEGDNIPVGRYKLEVLETPGHTRGGISLMGEGFVLGGDLVFAGGIGRVDLPGGDYATIIKSIRSKILTLGDKCVIYPGHGPQTTVLQEKLFNPFLIGEEDGI